MAQSWLIIERIENWEIDRAADFQYFGLSNRYRNTVANIAEKDLVFCYVSGQSAFADVRVVREAGLKPMKIQYYFDDFPLYIATAPLLVLPREKWIPVKEVADQLEMTRDRKDYRAMFQMSIRRLSPHDATFLNGRLEKAVNER
jgi:hypothetical protein